MLAEIIAAGSEMLTPFRQDTNSLFLTGVLNELGVEVGFKTIVGDSLEHLAGATRVALGRADLVIFSGGLGPTEDDLTREALAAALNLPLDRDPALIEALRQRFAERGFVMTPNNRKQADVLRGATVLENRNGSAPGQLLHAQFGQRPVIAILLPGPPKELKAMFTEQCRPRLAAVLPQRHIAKRTLRMLLVPESQADTRCAPIYSLYPDVQTTILAHAGEIQLHFQCAKPTTAEAQARVDELASRVEQQMAGEVFSSNGDTLEETLLADLEREHLTLAAAESCTGGVLSGRMTSVPGSSRSFVGAIVVYNNEAKSRQLDVPAELLDHEGAVSEPVARAMALGVVRRTGADLGLAITGLAGPDAGASGPDRTRPVGLVYVALAHGEGVVVQELHLSGDRERIRWWATQHALKLLWQTLRDRSAAPVQG